MSSYIERFCRLEKCSVLLGMLSTHYLKQSWCFIFKMFPIGQITQLSQEKYKMHKTEPVHTILSCLTTKEMELNVATQFLAIPSYTWKLKLKGGWIEVVVAMGDPGTAHLAHAWKWESVVIRPEAHLLLSWPYAQSPPLCDREEHQGAQPIKGNRALPRRFQPLPSPILPTQGAPGPAGF